MGTTPSRRMEDSDSRSRSNDNADQQDSDLATILQYLIRSGQVHIISPGQDDSDEDFIAAASPPRITNYTPDTKTLNMSEISLATKQSCGLVHSQGKERPASVTAMLSARESGMFGSGSFTRGDQCKISSSHLPSKKREVAVYLNKAFCGLYSNDGEQFLTACQDRYIRLYSTSGPSFKLNQTIQARDVGWSVLDTAFSPDGCWVVYTSWSESLHLCNLWDPDNQETLPLCPEDRRFCIFSVVFSSDGREILGGANDGFLYVYDRECNQRALRIEGHNDDVNTVAFADSTSQILYSGGDDGLCKVWDRRTLNESSPKPVGVLAGHMDGITYIDSRGDGRHLISNSKDQSIKLWDIRAFSSADAQENTRKAVAVQNWDYRWQKVPKKLVNVKNNLEGDTSVMTYRGHSVLQTLIRCHFSPSFTTGQRYIYTGCASGRVVIYDLLTGKTVRTLNGHQACVRDVSWHPYRPEIVSTSWDYSIVCWTPCKDKWSNSDTDSNPCEEERVELRRSARIAKQSSRQNANAVS